VSALPTREEIFQRAWSELDKASNALYEAGAWLRSDWTPVGSPLTTAQARARRSMQTAMATARRAIDRAKDAGDKVVSE
jgi:hypothetical protein